MFTEQTLSSLKLTEHHIQFTFSEIQETKKQTKSSLPNTNSLPFGQSKALKTKRVTPNQD